MEQATDEETANEIPPIPPNYTVERVPIGLLSSSVFTPDLPFRATQTSIGYFLKEKKTVAENSYGVHKSEYGGTGDTNLPLGEQEQIVTRQTHTVKTALHGAPAPPIDKNIMAKTIMNNRGFFGGPIKEVACDMYALLSTSKPLPKPGVKKIFPRSILYEIEYVKEQYRIAMMEALEKERKEFEALIKKEREMEAKKHHMLKSAEPADEVVHTKTDEIKEKEITEDENVGENVCQRKSKIKKEAEKNVEQKPCASFCGLCGCKLTRGECPQCEKDKMRKEELSYLEKLAKEGGECPKWKPQPVRYGAPWGEQRQGEMMRVNYPFKTEATSWHYCTHTPFSVSYRAAKKRFPEKNLSSINI